MISKEIFREIIFQQQHQQSQPKETVPRDIVEDILHWSEDPRILVLTGLRRSGKSTILLQLMTHLSPFCYVNFENERFLDFHAQDFEDLHEILIERYGTPTYYFFDEIQNIEKFETFVRRLQDQGKHIIITGSNASLLSKEFGTRLTGRYKSFEVYPFSFKEFLRYHHIQPKKQWSYITEKKVLLVRLFTEYLFNGGMPEFLKNQDAEYIKTVYENILYRDIIARYNIKQQKIFKELVNMLATTSSSCFTYNALKESLGLSNAITVKEYISYLQNSYLFFEVQKFDYSLKKQLNAPKKIYIIDPVFHRFCGMAITPDKGHLLENVVFIELKRRKKEVNYFSNNHQCDFVIKDGTKVTDALQVCYDLTENNKERELGGLLEAMDTFHLSKGLILTMEQEEDIKVEKKTIRVLPVWKWLLSF
jgi:predicted AAA+ superfamily ATPase